MKMVDGMYVQGMGSDSFDYDNETPTAHFSEIDAMDEPPCAKTSCRWWDKKADQNCGGMTPDGNPAIADCRSIKIIAK
jgi:hypothetical protein